MSMIYRIKSMKRIIHIMLGNPRDRETAQFPSGLKYSWLWNEIDLSSTFTMG